MIYSATNMINNKMYIGQTIHSLKRRKASHLTSVKQKKTIFQRAINKYGKENFIWEIIDYADCPEELDEKEIYWISYFDTYRYGYNMTIGGQGFNRLKQKYECHTFLVFDKHGNFLNDYNNKFLFCSENNIPTGDADVVLSNYKPSVKDYVLIYIEDYSETNLKQRLKRIRYNREFAVFDLDKQYIGTWSNQLQCERELELKRGCINKCLTKVVSKINGYYFYYTDECPEELKTLYL